MPDQGWLASVGLPRVTDQGLLLTGDAERQRERTETEREESKEIERATNKFNCLFIFTSNLST